MGEEEHAHGAVRWEDALEEIGESGLAEGADRQAGQRDADLDTGNDAVEIRKKLLDYFGLSAALGDQLANAREAHGYKRELDGGEETVERHQNEYADQPDQEHKVERTSQRHCSSRFGRIDGGVECGCRMERIENSLPRGKSLRCGGAGCAVWRRPLN
jgi:hypothetical protein